MANFKRKHHRSSMMKRCTICGSQRRFGGNSLSKLLRSKPATSKKAAIHEALETA